MGSFSILRRVSLLQWTTIFIGILLIASQGIYLSFANALGTTPPSIIEVRGMNYKGSIILYWKNADQINTTSLANDYIVQYKKSTDSAYSVFTDGVSTNTYARLTGFERGFIYDFRILPKNDSGNGSVSNLIEIPYTPDTSTVSPTIYSSLQQSIDVPIATIQNPNITSPSSSVSPGSTPSGGTKTSFDTTPPTAPANLILTNKTESTLSLSWSSSTDNIGVAGYRIYRNNIPLYITNSGVTRYTDTNLKDGTKYIYSITAFDAKSNSSLPSATLTGETLKKTSDTTPPTAPTAPKFIANTDSSTSFSWTPSKDNIGVASYRIYRNDTFITTMTGLTYTDTGLLSSTSYTYTVVALDAAGNYSTPSPKITIRTLQKIRDTVPPSVPKNFAASNIITNAVTLTWSSSTDNIGVTGYNVYRKGVLLTTITDTTYTDSSLTPDTAYSYFIRASDAAGNLSIQTNTINITTKPVQTPGPTPTPLNDISSVAVSSITQVGATITWVTGSPSDSSVEYGLTTTYGSKTPVDTKLLMNHSIALTGLSSGKTYHYRVLSKDSIGRVSASPDATFSTPNSTPSQDTIPPSVPTTLTTSNITSTNITLTWSASTDNVSVAGYNIYRNGISIATSTTSLYSDSNLTPSTTYSYAVSAYDSAGNTSALTSSVRATTQKGGTPGIYTLGWNELFSTKLKDVCPPDGQKDWNGNKYLFSYYCRSVIAAWSSGIFDSFRNRFILWGGGHGDYFGNELYALNLGQTPPNLVRLNDPSPINTDLNDCKETLSDGNPNSRHTYGGLVYIQHADRMFTFGGSLACGGGNTSYGTWTLDMSNLKWKRMDPVNGVKGTIPGSYYANPPVTADYDINTKLVFVTDNHVLWSYNYDTNTYVLLNQGMNLPTNSYGVIDPKRKLFIFMGSPYLKEGTPKIEAISLASGSTYQLQDWSSEVKGCDAIAGADYPGLTYDSAIDRIVGWPGLGNSVYIFNPDTKTCMIQTFTNGPANPQDSGGNPVTFVNNGTLARFKYIPSMDAILAINSWINNAYILKISTGSNLPAQDTTAPTVPSGFTGKIISSTQANLAWSASTDNVSVAGYNIYRNGVQVATVNTPSYSDNSLSSNTSYSYVISAFDAAGNTSGQSNTLSVDTPATSNLAPTVSLSSSQLTITTGSSVTLTWSTIGAVSCTASDGWSGVKAISGSASFSPTQTTNYILTCYNASGLSSVKSITVNVSSQPSSGINGGLIGYWPFDKIIGNATNDYSGNNNLGVLANSPVASSGKIGGAIHFNGTNSDIVTPATIRSEAGSISVWVKPEATMGSQRAYPVFITTADGNSLKLYFDGYNGKNNSWTFELRGTFGNFISITSPVNSNAELQQWQHIIVTWDVNKGANMYINGALKASSNMKTGLIVSPGLTIGSDIKTFLGYMDEFRLYDRVLSSKDITDVYTSTQLAIAPTGPDISRPTTPANFTGNPSSQTTIDLFWKAAADNVGVSGYKIFRDGVQIGTTVNNSYTDKNLNPNTIYKYSVVAYDAAGNISSNSNVSSVPTSPPALALLSGNNGTIPGPGPQPVIPETALHISESPYMGTTWAMILFDLAPWIHPGGDWRDKNFVLQGTSPWATGVIRNSGTEQKVAFNVTSLIINQKGSTAQKIANRGWLLTPGGGTTIATLYSKESNIASNRPVLHVITTTGTYDLAPEGDTGFSLSSSLPDQTESQSYNVSTNSYFGLWFNLDLIVGTVTSATLTMTTTSIQYGGSLGSIYLFPVDMYETFTNIPLKDGIASKYKDDIGLEKDPDVIYMERYPDANLEKRGWGASQVISSVVGDSDPNDSSFKPLATGIKSLKMTIPKGGFGGDAGHWNFWSNMKDEPEELYIRTYARMSNDFDSMGGKFPFGFDGTYIKSSEWVRNPATGRSYTRPDAPDYAGNGGATSDGTNGWSARGGFFAQDCNTGSDCAVPSKVNPLFKAGYRMLDYYNYHADQPDIKGEIFRWDRGLLGLIPKNKWFSIDQYVKMNTVNIDGSGNKDGVLRVWIDGRLAFEKTDFRMRNWPGNYAGAMNIKVSSVWLNFYHGGLSPANSPMTVYLANTVISKSYVGPSGMK